MLAAVSFFSLNLLFAFYLADTIALCNDNLQIIPPQQLSL